MDDKMCHITNGETLWNKTQWLVIMMMGMVMLPARLLVGVADNLAGSIPASAVASLSTEKYAPIGTRSVIFASGRFTTAAMGQRI